MKFLPPYYRSRVLRRMLSMGGESTLTGDKENLERLYFLLFLCLSIGFFFSGLFTLQIDKYLETEEVLFPRFEAFAWCPGASNYQNLIDAYQNMPRHAEEAFMPSAAMDAGIFGKGPGIIQANSVLNKRFYGALQQQGLIRPLSFSWTPSQHNMILVNFHRIRREFKGCKKIFLRAKGLHLVAFQHLKNNNKAPAIINIEKIKWQYLQKTHHRVIPSRENKKNGHGRQQSVTDFIDVDTDSGLFLNDYLVGQKLGNRTLLLKGGEHRINYCQVSRGIVRISETSIMDTEVECDKNGPEDWELEISKARGLNFPMNILLQISTKEEPFLQKSVYLDFMQMVVGRDTMLRDPFGDYEDIELRRNDYIPLSNYVPKQRQFDYKYGMIESEDGTRFLSKGRASRKDIEMLYNLPNTERNLTYYSGAYMNKRQLEIAKRSNIGSFPARDGFYEKLIIENPSSKSREEFSLLIYAALLGIAITMFIESIFLMFEILRVRRSFYG